MSITPLSHRVFKALCGCFEKKKKIEKEEEVFEAKYFIVSSEEREARVSKVLSPSFPSSLQPTPADPPVLTVEKINWGLVKIEEKDN